MTLPTVHGASFREYEVRGCPIMQIAGGEYISLDRVARMLGLSRGETLRRLAPFDPPLPWDDEAGAINPIGPLFEDAI